MKTDKGNCYFDKYFHKTLKKHMKHEQYNYAI